MNIGCTVENQKLADYRLPVFLSYSMKRRFIAGAPLFKRDGIVEKINPFKQTRMAKELGINILDGKRLF